jgi:hypothetical protein
MANEGNKIVVNTGLPGFILIDGITGVEAENIDGTRDFAAAPIYLGIESLAQLGAYHVRFLTRFEKHAFLLKINRCRVSAGQFGNGRYLLHGSLISKSESAFAYNLQARRGDNVPSAKGKLSDETQIAGEFLYATVNYDDIFKKEILRNHYRKVFSCLRNDVRTDCSSRGRPACTEILPK